jgi:hypothetical protein
MRKAEPMGMKSKPPRFSSSLICAGFVIGGATAGALTVLAYFVWGFFTYTDDDQVGPMIAPILPLLMVVGTGFWMFIGAVAGGAAGFFVWSLTRWLTSLRRGQVPPKT